jgi:hypothetical protein
MTNTIQARREELQEIIWDVAKDATGVRPRWIDFENSTIAELEDTLESYTQRANEQYDAEVAEEIRAVADYEALVVETTEMGAGDRSTAVRWIVETYAAEDTHVDVEDILWKMGLPCWKATGPYAYIREELAAWI